MVISDKYRFVFLHIPKCAGTSVRVALDPFDDRRERYLAQGVEDHEELGRLDYHHIPLKTLREYFADDYRCVEDYRAFAVIRDPRTRFPASLAQKLSMYNGLKLDKLTADEVKREIDEVISRLSAVPKQTPVLQPELIHFSRQIDYIEIDGYRPVDNIYAIENINWLFSEIENITSRKLATDDVKNYRFNYKYPVLSSLDYIARSMLETVLPTRLWVPFSSLIKRALIRANILQKTPEAHSDIFESSFVRDFINDFYKDDRLLYRKLSTK